MNEALVLKFFEKYGQTPTQLVRDEMNQIDWSNRLVGIKGSRGVGKTTLVLQYIKNNFKPNEEVLYVSLDHIYFANNLLYQLADDFYKKGGKLLVMDEVHRYPNWSQEIKNIYDDFPALRMIFTGSSLLQISKAKADLSRRAVMYTLPELSFRNYLKFSGVADFNPITLEDLLSHHIDIALEICRKTKPLLHFSNYLHYGCYPFFLENIKSYHQKLYEAILVAIEIDIAQFEQVQPANLILLKKLLDIISRSVPFKPNLSNISQRTGLSINTVKNYIQYLRNANLISLLYNSQKGINSLNKPEKIYLANPNLMYAMVGETLNQGNVRETFLYSQLKNHFQVHAPGAGDFLINSETIIEVGGKGKSTGQIAGLPNAYIAADNIEIGVNKKIPLWLFGFLY